MTGYPPLDVTVATAGNLEHQHTHYKEPEWFPMRDTKLLSIDYKLTAQFLPAWTIKMVQSQTTVSVELWSSDWPNDKQERMSSGLKQCLGCLNSGFPSIKTNIDKASHAALNDNN